MQKYDVIVVGAGPSGIFLCLELKNKRPETRILLIDQGRAVEKRKCPVSSGGKCVKCKPFCHITNGFSGAGAFSDGKLSLVNEEDEDIYVGGKIHEYLGVKKTKELINYTDNIYLNFGADKKKEGIEFLDEINAYKEKSKKYGVDLISVPIRHLGTEKAHKLYKDMQDELERIGVYLMLETEITDIIIKDGKVQGVKAKEKNISEESNIYADTMVLGVGRKGANWLKDMCLKHGIKDKAGIVDIGIRYELKDEVMKEINNYV